MLYPVYKLLCPFLLTILLHVALLQLKNPYMGYAKFRAAFAGDASDNWLVTPSDGVLKQNEDTHFAVTFRPQHPGVSSGYLVIETHVSCDDEIG